MTKSDLVRVLIKHGNKRHKEVAEYLGITKAYFSNKLVRDSWSFENIVDVAECCGFKMKFERHNPNLPYDNILIIDGDRALENYTESLLSVWD